MTSHTTPLQPVATSPDGHVAISFAIADITTACGGTRRLAPLWSVTYRGRAALRPSPLAVAIAGEPPLGAGFTLLRRRRHGTNGMTLTLQENGGLRRIVVWHFHCDNDHAACSFSLPRQPHLPRRLIVEGDRSLWNLPPGANATTDAATGAAVIAYDHGHMALACGWGGFTGHANWLALTYGGSDITTLPFRSSQRVLRLAQRPCDLPTVAFDNPTASRGGAVVRDDTFSTSGGLAAVALAASLGARYVLYDYCWCGDTADSATSGLVPDPAPSLKNRYAGWSGLDIATTARAAHSRGIGVLLALPWETFCHQQQELLTTYRQWGVAGLKVGRFNAPPNAATATRLRSAAAAAAANDLLFIVDDPAWYALADDPTLPLHINNAAAPGQHCRADLLQLGLLASPAAATTSPLVSPTSAYRAALPFVAANRFPILFNGHPQAIIGRQALLHPLWRMLPPTMAWDETRWLRGESGQYAVVARRHTARWFIACLNHGAERVHTVRLEDLLPPDRFWRTTLYRDPTTADPQPHDGIIIEHLGSLHSTDRIKLEVAASGGYLLIIQADNTVQTHV